MRGLPYFLCRQAVLRIFSDFIVAIVAEENWLFVNNSFNMHRPPPETEDELKHIVSIPRQKLFSLERMKQVELASVIMIAVDNGNDRLIVKSKFSLQNLADYRWVFFNDNIRYLLRFFISPGFVDE